MIKTTFDTEVEGGFSLFFCKLGSFQLLYRILPDGLPQLGQVGGECRFVICIGQIQPMFVRRPGGEIGSVMLYECLQSIQSLENACLEGLALSHFFVER